MTKAHKSGLFTSLRFAYRPSARSAKRLIYLSCIIIVYVHSWSMNEVLPEEDMVYGLSTVSDWLSPKSSPKSAIARSLLSSDPEALENHAIVVRVSADNTITTLVTFDQRDVSEGGVDHSSVVSYEAHLSKCESVTAISDGVASAPCFTDSGSIGAHTDGSSVDSDATGAKCHRLAASAPVNECGVDATHSLVCGGMPSAKCVERFVGSSMGKGCVGCHASQNQDTCRGCASSIDASASGTHVEIDEVLADGASYSRCYERASGCLNDCSGHGTCYSDYNSVTQCKCDTYWFGSDCSVAQRGIFDAPECPGGVCSCDASSNCGNLDGAIYGCETTPEVKDSSDRYLSGKYVWKGDYVTSGSQEANRPYHFEDEQKCFACALGWGPVGSCDKTCDSSACTLPRGSCALDGSSHLCQCEVGYKNPASGANDCSECASGYQDIDGNGVCVRVYTATDAQHLPSVKQACGFTTKPSGEQTVCGGRGTCLEENGNVQCRCPDISTSSSVIAMTHTCECMDATTGLELKYFGGPKCATRCDSPYCDENGDPSPTATRQYHGCLSGADINTPGCLSGTTCAACNGGMCVAECTGDSCTGTCLCHFESGLVPSGYTEAGTYYTASTHGDTCQHTCYGNPVFANSLPFTTNLWESSFDNSHMSEWMATHGGNALAPAPGRRLLSVGGDLQYDTSLYNYYNPCESTGYGSGCTPDWTCPSGWSNMESAEECITTFREHAVVNNNNGYTYSNHGGMMLSSGSGYWSDKPPGCLTYVDSGYVKVQYNEFIGVPAGVTNWFWSTGVRVKLACKAGSAPPAPTDAPTGAPTDAPTGAPTNAPTPPTLAPTTAPTGTPTVAPTESPTIINSYCATYGGYCSPNGDPTTASGSGNPMRRSAAVYTKLDGYGMVCEDYGHYTPSTLEECRLAICATEGTEVCNNPGQWKGRFSALDGYGAGYDTGCMFFSPGGRYFFNDYHTDASLHHNYVSKKYCTDQPPPPPPPAGGCNCLSSFSVDTKHYIDGLMANSDTSGDHHQARDVAFSSGNIKVSPTCNMPKGAYADASISTDYTDFSVNECTSPENSGDFTSGSSFETVWVNNTNNPAVCGPYYYTPIGHESYGLLPNGATCDCVQRQAYQEDMTSATVSTLSGACCPVGHHKECISFDGSGACTACGCVADVDPSNPTPLDTFLTGHADKVAGQHTYYTPSAVTPFTSQWATTESVYPGGRRSACASMASSEDGCRSVCAEVDGKCVCMYTDSSKCPKAKPVITQTAVTEYEKSSANMKHANKCPIYGTRRFFSNRCRLPKTMRSRAMCGRYCGSCHFCQASFDTASGVCACRSSGVSRAISMESARRMLGAEEARGHLVDSYVRHMQMEHIKSRINQVSHAKPQQQAAAQGGRRLLAVSSGMTAGCSAAGGSDLTSSCSSNSVAKVNSKSSGYEIDISSCLSGLSDGEAFEVEVRALDANGNQVGSSVYAKSDYLSLDVKRPRGQSCAKGKKCGSSGQGHRVVLRRSDRTRAVDYDWQGFLESGSDVGQTGLSQSLSFNSVVGDMQLDITGKCLSAGTVKSKMVLRSNKKSGSVEQNSMHVEVQTSCTAPPTFSTRSVMHKVQKGQTDNPLQLNTNCPSGCAATPCSLASARDTTALASTGLTFDGATCSFSGAYTGAGCFETLSGQRGSKRAIGVILTDSQGSSARLNVGIKCSEGDVNAAPPPTRMVVSAMPSINTIVAPFANGKSDGSLSFNSATMDRTTSTMGATSSPLLECSDDGVKVKAVSGSSGVHSIKCKQTFSSKDTQQVLYTQSRVVNIRINPLLSDGSSQALVTSVAPAALSQISRRAGVVVSVEVSCHASEFTLDCRQEGSEVWRQCTGTGVHTISQSTCVPSARRSGESFSSASVIIDGMQFDTSMEIRAVASSGLSVVQGDTQIFSTPTVAAHLDSASDGDTIRMDALPRSKLSTKVKLTSADASTAAGLLTKDTESCPVSAVSCTDEAQSISDCETLGATKTVFGSKQKCCLNKCNAQKWSTAVTGYAPKAGFLAELKQAWFGITGTPVASIAVSDASFSEADDYFYLVVEESEATDDGEVSRQKEDSILSGVTGVVATLAAALTGVTGASVDYTGVDQGQTYQRKGSFTVSASATGLTIDVAKKSIISATAATLGISERDIYVPSIDMSSVSSRRMSPTLINYMIMISAAGSMQRVQSILDSDASGTLTSLVNGITANTIAINIQEAMSSQLDSEFVVENTASSTGTLSEATTDKAVTELELCNYNLEGVAFKIDSNAKTSFKCATGENHFNIGYQGGIALENAELETSIVVSDPAPRSIQLSGVSTQVGMSDIIKIDDTKVDTSSASEMAAIVSGIDLQGISPPQGDTTSFTLKATSSGADLAASDATLSASLQTKAPRVVLGVSVDANSGKSMPTITRKTGSSAPVKVPLDRYTGDVHEKVVRFERDGVVVDQDMVVTRVEDENGDLLANLLTSKMVAQNPSCSDVTFRFVGTEDASSQHDSTIASSLNHGVSQMKNTFAVQKDCDSSACGCKDENHNVIEAPFDNGVQLVSFIHCPCDYDMCYAGSQLTDPTTGARCVFSLKGSAKESDVCDAADSAGAGKKLCRIKGVHFSTGGGSGSTGTDNPPACGDGNLEAMLTSHNNRCPMVGSQAIQQSQSVSSSTERCDVKDSALYGQFSSGCGSASLCNLGTTSMDLTDKASAGDLKKQRIWGLTTSNMQNLAFDPYDTQNAQTVPQINPCLYSSQMEKDDGTGTFVDEDDFSLSGRCKISAADRIKFTTLANCYNSDPSSVNFGKRLDGTNGDAQQNQDFLLYGHKCNEVLGIQISSPTGGKQSWEPTLDAGDGFTVTASTSASEAYPSMYPLCFQITDPSWPSLHPSSKEFLAQRTRIQYQVVCDPYDQDESYGGDHCEDVADYGNSNPAEMSHKCTRLGNRVNPCSQIDRLWSLYTCDDDNCESLETLSSEYTNPYKSGASDKKGTAYTFEHDSMPNKNKFECSTKDFDNEKLASQGFMQGDATEAQSKHICATGGQEASCDEGLGEIVHFIDTCSSGQGSHRDITSLQHADPANWVSNPTEGTQAHDVQTYPIGCNKQLRIRIKKSVAGQMMLRVVARSYNTAVEEGDASKGYTYWTSKLVPVSIEAKVKSLVASDISVATGSLSVDEAQSTQFFLGGTSPFDSLNMVTTSHSSDTTRATKFSRSTRAHVEFVECTSSLQKLAIETQTAVPRFSIDTKSGGVASGTGFSGRYTYHENSGVDASLRTYELALAESYKGPTIEQLKLFDPKLELRSSTNILGGESDSYHEGYSGSQGLCMKTRLHLYEPSSCSYTNVDSDEYHISVPPTNLNPPTVSFAQTQYIYGEDESVSLKVEVTHPDPATDSKMWYFSHVEITDMNAGSISDADTQGTLFELFSYGNTRGATGGHSDSASSTPGITRVVGTNKWVSYANDCTRWIYENGQTAGNEGGFSSANLALGGFATAEACLNDARRFTGYPAGNTEEIWSDSGAIGTKGGIWLRPRRKSTKNIHLQVKVVMIDGSAGWHSGTGMVEQVATSEIHLLHVPRSTRYDQQEVLMQDITLAENAEKTLEFNPVHSAGIGLPIPYRPNTHLCTYVHGPGPNEDDVARGEPDHDNECDPTASSSASNAVVFGTCGSATTGFVIKCLAHDATRGQLDGVTIFDESAMVLPEGTSYQPAGNNAAAHDDQQWYALEPAGGSSSVHNMWWCNDHNEAQGYNPSATDSISGGHCVLNKKLGTSQDTINGNDVTVVDAALQNGAAASDNFWIVQRVGGSTSSLELQSIRLDAKSDFNTRSLSSYPNEQIKLRLVATLKDSVSASNGLMTQIDSSFNPATGSPRVWSAVSTSHATQGLFTVVVTSNRQQSVPHLEAHAWGATSHSKIEERNDHSRDQVAAARSWADVATTKSLILVSDKDCGSTEPSSTFCADRVRYTEQNDFHDQHFGRVSLGACVRKLNANGAGQHSACSNAGGLFEVQVQLDDGSVVAIGDATSPLSEISGSKCVIEFSSQISSDVDAERGKRCVMRPKVDDIGAGAIPSTWENEKLWKVLTASGATTPLAARELKSRLRIVLPHKWSNDIEFEFSLLVGNDDRDDPRLGVNDYSTELKWQVRPQKIAEEPVMWLGTNLAYSFGALGTSTNAIAKGVVALGMGNRPGGANHGTDPYIEPTLANGPSLNLDQNQAMSSIEVVAGYQHQIMVKVGTAAFDDQNEVLVPTLSTGSDYAWDEMRALLSASGERVYLTISSKYDMMFPDANNPGASVESPQQFCAWLCPESSSGGCSKSQLQRLAPLESGDDFTQSDVNCDGGTGTDCVGGSNNHGRDSQLTGCPMYTPGNLNNPGSRYSYRCQDTGTCDELRYLYIQYPAEQIKDDLLEICAWSRDDYRDNGDGYQHVCTTMNVKVQPAITLESVGFNSISSNGCDDVQPGVNCPTGLFGAPLQSHQVALSQNNKMLISVYESDLHGSPNDCRMDTNVPANTGSNAEQANCGFRFPISFAAEKDSNGNFLTLVSPVGVELTIGIESETTSRLTTAQLAQALMLKCTQQARQATGATVQQCVDEMSSTASSNTLAFLDSLGAVSAYPANRLSWAVGETMEEKEILLRGDASSQWSPSDYSFENEKCELDRSFTVTLTHLAGYTPSIVNSQRSTIDVIVKDDDFFGKVTMATLDNGALTSISSDSSVSHTKADWVSQEASQGLQEGFVVYVMRERSAFEAGVDSTGTALVGIDANNNGKALRSLDVAVKLSVGTFEDNEFVIEVCDADQAGALSGCTPQAISTIRVSQGMHIMVPFAEESGAGPFAQGLSSAKAIKFKKNPSFTPSCNTGQDASVAFELAFAKYKSTNQALDNTLFSGCGDRNPVDTTGPTSSAASFSVSVNIQNDAPFQLDFAGFRSSYEASKSAPLSWNAGLDGSYVSITETEHSDCSASGMGYACTPRSFKIHMCRELRGAFGTSFGNNAEVTTEFFVQIEDSDLSYAQIENYYQLDCPSTASLNNIRDNLRQSGLNSLTCEQMSTKVDTNTGAAIPCTDANSECNTKGTRLLWKVQTAQNAGSEIFMCPSTLSDSSDSTFQYLPYAIFSNRDDAGIINLSRRPKLIITNDKKLDASTNTVVSTCTFAGPQSQLSLRIEDDEVFSVDNTQIDAETSEHRVEFGTPTWDSTQGRLKVAVKAPYFTDGKEKTLVNVGVGSCNKNKWEAPFHSNAPNPLGLFGSCDMLKNNLNQAALATMTNEEAFDAVFGSGSHQPTQAEYDAAADNGLFGYTAGSGTNYLFSSLNSNPAGGSHTNAWSTEKSTMDNHGNSDFSTNGFTATFSASIEDLMACRDYLDVSVANAKVDPTNGDTIYEFVMSATQLTAMRQGDTTYAHWSASCTETTYALRVSNSIFALSGIDSNTQRNSIYVVNAEYDTQDHTAQCGVSNCDATIGPQHACPTDPDVMVRALKYDVNIDMRDVVNTVLQNGAEVTTYFGVAYGSDVTMSTDNCYGVQSTLVSPKVGGADDGAAGAGVTRTTLQFKSGCASLQNPSGVYVSDTFASCAAGSARATDFDFTVRLYECTEKAHLADPANHNDCQKLPDSLRVNIALAHTQNPIAVEYQVAFDKLQRFYKTYDHRNADGTFPASLADVATWRQDNAYVSSELSPYVTYSPQSVLVASLGFVQGSALQATMTSALRRVRLCRFREFCSIDGIAPEDTTDCCDPADTTCTTKRQCAPKCTEQNTIIDKTHSPYARWASNTKLDTNDKGCADPSAQNSCKPSTTQTAVAIPEFTCQRSNWEDFLISELTAVTEDTSISSSVQTQLGVSVLTVASLAVGFNPVIEAQLMVDHGTTTDMAEAIYGNCEKTPELAGEETINSMKVTHMFPQADSSTDSVGACTCKGQRAYNYNTASDGSGTYTYRASKDRKVVYSTSDYSDQLTDAANLHVCTWRNAPHHSSSSEPLRSSDQFVMSTNKLLVGETYFIEMEAKQYDHTAFDADELNGTSGPGDAVDPDQFGLGSRRLLAETSVLKMPRADTVVSVQPPKASSTPRRILSMGSVSDEIQQTLIFPQGTARLTENTQPGYSTHSTAGIVIQGPTTEHQLDTTGVEAELEDENLMDVFSMFEIGSFQGLEQSWNTMSGILEDSLLNGKMEDTFTANKVRLSAAVAPIYGAVNMVADMSAAGLSAATSSFAVMAPGVVFAAAKLHSRTRMSHFSKGPAMVHEKNDKESAKISEWIYSTQFFDHGYGVSWHQQGKCHAFFAIFLNELSLILGGYYVLSWTLTALAWTLSPIMLLEYCRGGKQYFRRFIMKIAFTLLDYSCMREAISICFGWCLTGRSATNQVNGYYARNKWLTDKSKSTTRLCSAIIKLLFMIFVRFWMMVFSALFLPISLIFAAAHWIVIWTWRLTVIKCGPQCMTMTNCVFWGWGDKEKQVKNRVKVESGNKGQFTPDFDTFLGYDYKMPDNENVTDAEYKQHQLIKRDRNWSIFPWEWRGWGNGFLEVSSLHGNNDDAGVAEKVYPQVEEADLQASPFTATTFAKSGGDPEQGLSETDAMVPKSNGKKKKNKKGGLVL